MFAFEFDQTKSQANRSKHGIDFIDAQLLWDDPRLLEIPAKTEDEPRYVVIGLIDGKRWSAVITYRNIRSSADSGMLFLQTFLEQQEHHAHGVVIEPLPVRQMLREVVYLLRRSASAKGMTLELAEHETVVVSGLRAGVTHVLQDLVSNAIKYSPHDSRVEITALAHGKHGRILVMDRGPGISEDDQEKLFQRFVRLSSEPTEGESATGLGLASAKQHARAMGGNLWYELRDGGGSIFTLELPLS